MATSNLYRHGWKSFGLPEKRIFQSILFPIDFSTACESTAQYVRDLAEFTGSNVTLLHVVPWTRLGMEQPTSISIKTELTRCAT